jgi:hypothetical protein
VDDVDCFQTRFMWRSDGESEVYADIPFDANRKNGLCEREEVICNSDFGQSLGRGSWYWKRYLILYSNLIFKKNNRNEWNKIRQVVKLNINMTTASGTIAVWKNDKLVLSLQNLYIRTYGDVFIKGIFFSTFFGGSTEDWACKKNEYTYFKNFKLISNVTVPNENYFANDSSSIISSLFICLLLPTILLII